MIDNLKEFERFLKLCRKQGVTEASVGGVSVKIGNKPERESSKKKAEESDEIETDSLTPDELMFYHLRDQGANQ